MRAMRTWRQLEEGEESGFPLAFGTNASQMFSIG